MKKTLLASFLAGITFAGAAFAVPTPEDRQKLCEKDPFKYVWVKKTQACVPVDPCADDVNMDIKDAYCIMVPGFVKDAHAEDAAGRYVKNVMKLGIKSGKVVNVKDKPSLVDFCCHTTDCGYYVFRFKPHWQDTSDSSDPMIGQINNLYDNGVAAVACWAYGKEEHYSSKEVACLNVNTQAECDDIADFASVISEEPVTGTVEQLGVKVCWLSR